MLGCLLVDIGLAVVSLLVKLVADGITSSLGSGGELCVAVLGDVLVGLLGRTRGGLVDLVRDEAAISSQYNGQTRRVGRTLSILGGVLDGIHCDDWCIVWCLVLVE